MAEGQHTVKAISKDTAGNIAESTTTRFTVDLVPPTVTVSPAGGTYNTVQSVTLASGDPSATIYYTTDGSEPLLLVPNIQLPLT